MGAQMALEMNWKPSVTHRHGVKLPTASSKVQRTLPSPNSPKNLSLTMTLEPLSSEEASTLTHFMRRKIASQGRELLHWAGEAAQLGDCLPSMQSALGFDPQSTALLL